MFARPMLERIFPGKSEMALRMRRHDWAATPLGPAERWPQSLRTSVSTCLDCAFPIVLWWGPELTILYNDEYKAIMGPAKDSSALGERGDKVWAEIWGVIGPMLSHVMETAEATRSRDLMLHIDREGYPEEAYFSFSYSPIHAEEGKVGGIFCPVIETTQRVIGERRLRTLRDLAARTRGADHEAAVYEIAARVLEENPQDVPFAMVYRVSENGSDAYLQATAGIKPGTPASPVHVPLEAEDGPWSLAAVAHRGRMVRAMDLARYGELPTGAWTTPPAAALVLPVQLPGQQRPRAILVAALSPMRALDVDYRTFYGLIATQMASGLADAQALEEERRRADALAEIDRAKTAFFSNVSHEFRTPLTLMLGPLEEVLAEAHGKLPPAAAQALSTAHRNSLRLLKLVNTLLDFSRIEAGRMEASYQPTDLAQLTTELASVFRSAMEKAGLRLIVDCPPLPEPVYVDRDLWEKIVLNLLSNALKFTFEGEVEVRLHCDDHRVALTVRDTGIGVAPADLPRMFERFHRVRNALSRTHEGTGIGLALVQELARLHGGEVSVTSQEGRGTTFTVHMPRGKEHLPKGRIQGERQASSTSLGAVPFLEEALRSLPEDIAPDFGAPSPAPRTALPIGDQPPPCVLVVDDNADMRQYLRGLLEQRYRVALASDGEAALSQIRTSRPDLVVTDVMMPRLDGFGLLAAIRADDRLRSLPVIVLSARAGEEARIEGLSAGADDYLIKPFTARELMARVGSQLEMARMRREGDRRKDEFLATLAHELRTPLAPICNTLNLLRLSDREGVSVEHSIEILERQVQSLVRLVDDLMEMSRITSGKIELRRERVSIARVIQGAIETSMPLIQARQHTLATALPAEALAVDADPVRLEQVVVNLLNNAAKYTEPGGRIWLEARREGSQVVVTVRDTGAGISPEMLPRVFEAFTQAERTYNRSQGGLGIGLTLVRSLVEMHGGTVLARSAGPGQGSEFVVRLPLSDKPVREAAEPRPSARMSLAGRRMVVVDDNRDSATSLAMLLRVLGGDVLSAHDGVSALAAVERHRPSVVLVDIGMPGMDGYELARRIRERQGGRRMTMIALSGWGQPEDRLRSVRAGIDHHLVKPVSLEALEQLLGGLDTSEAEARQPTA